MDTKHLKINPDLPTDTNKLFGNPWTTAFLKAIKSPRKIGMHISLKAEKECLQLLPYISLAERSLNSLQWAQEGLQAIQITDQSKCKMTIKWKRSE